MVIVNNNSIYYRNIISVYYGILACDISIKLKDYYIKELKNNEKK